MNLRPADYESGGLVVLTGETPRILRGFLMQASPSCSIRAYPERRPSRITATEPELMAYLSRVAICANKFYPTEPAPNSNLSRKRVRQADVCDVGVCNASNSRPL